MVQWEPHPTAKGLADESARLKYYYMVSWGVLVVHTPQMRYHGGMPPSV